MSDFFPGDDTVGLLEWSVSEHRPRPPENGELDNHVKPQKAPGHPAPNFGVFSYSPDALAIFSWGTAREWLPSAPIPSRRPSSRMTPNHWAELGKGPDIFTRAKIDPAPAGASRAPG